jgi:hypothetical protein
MRRVFSSRLALAPGVVGVLMSIVLARSRVPGSMR